MKAYVSLLAAAFSVGAGSLHALPADSGTEALYAPRRRIALEDNLAKTLLLPAWGAFESESYFLSGFQLIVDGLALAAIINEVVNPIEDAGAGVPTLFGLTLLGANRLVSLPVNRYFARDFNGSDEEFEAGGPMRPAGKPARGSGRLAVVLASEGIDHRLGYGVSLKLGRGHLKIQYAATGARDAFAYMDEAAGMVRHVSFEETAIWDAGYDWDWNPKKWLTVSPGARVRLSRLRTNFWERGSGTATDASGGEIQGQGVRVIPRIGVSVIPHRRVAFGLAVGYPLTRPRPEEEYLKRLRMKEPDAQGPERFQFGLEAAFYLL